ncbi:MAG: hypothetical protein ACRC8S_10280 [Fimbriiglobus sp.]
MQTDIEHLVIDYPSGGPKVSTSVGSLASEEAALKVAANYGQPQQDALLVTGMLERVAVVRVSGSRFTFTILPLAVYRERPDPFLWAEHPQGDFTLPVRTTQNLMQIFQTGDLPWLLGSTQILLDGGKLILIRPDSAEASLRQLWSLLPTATQADLRFTTFANHFEPHWQIQALAVAPANWPDSCFTEDQARDTPEGRHELALQVAVESGDETALQQLLGRRTSQQTLRMVALLVAFAMVSGVIVKVLF